jgi:hypothetical protein
MMLVVPCEDAGTSLRFSPTDRAGIVSTEKIAYAFVAAVNACGLNSWRSHGRLSSE